MGTAAQFCRVNAMSSISPDIRLLLEGDLAQVTHIHLVAFPGSALTRLGMGAVERYYHWLLLGPHQALCIGAFMEGVLAGFCFGGKFRGATSGFLQKNRWYLGGLVLTHPWLAFNPFFRQRLQEGLHGLRHARQNTKATIEERRKKQNSFSLLAIATDPCMQKMGIGSALMARAEAYALEQNYQEMGLSVHTGNLPAFGFYRTLGWQTKQEIGENTIMIKALDSRLDSSIDIEGENL
jgi:ribosomal protein S18 acetylase RimI-like enzyme